MTDKNLNNKPSNSEKPVFNCQKKLEELNYERSFYDNFYKFNKATGLGKK